MFKYGTLDLITFSHLLSNCPQNIGNQMRIIADVPLCGGNIAMPGNLTDAVQIYPLVSQLRD